ncbi:MAG: tetracycline resistance efflux system leader peptide [Terriglobia bacterium]
MLCNPMNRGQLRHNSRC